MAIKRVMLVDDEADIRRIGELSLARVGGWTVTLAASGQEALDKLAEALPDVILLDVMMPGMDGPQTLTHLRARPEAAHVPVIFVTARVQRQEIELYLALGASGVIAKPFDPMGLPDEVRQIIAAL